MNKLLTIGQLSEQIDITAVAIRYYEREGLIPKSKRSQGGFRLYESTIIPQLHFIKNAKSVGFSLDEIKSLFAIQKNKITNSQAIKSLTETKIADIKFKINTLKKIQTVLETWVSTCDGKSPVNECPILEKLFQSHNACV